VTGTGHGSQEYLSEARDFVAQGEPRLALKALERARQRALAEKNLDQLDEILRLAIRLRDETRGKLQYASGSLAHSAVQNIRFLTRQHALEHDERWIDPAASLSSASVSSPSLAEADVRRQEPGAPDGEVASRLDRLEQEVARLRAELTALRAPGPTATVTTRVQAPTPPARAERPPAPPAQPVPAHVAPPAPPKAERRPAPPPPPPRRTLGELARDWDLVGARGFAIVGGAVMALGIGLFFVLAANRGWINEETRVLLGATASALVFSAGLVLRWRYGQYWSALAAVGAGVAGAYATLAAATVRYDLIPDGLALPLAGVIAAIGTMTAIRLRSQVIAGIGLLGAALAPALQAIDATMTWESAAFALIVLVAAGSVAAPRHWHELLIATSVIVGTQVEWLVAQAGAPAGVGTISVAVVFSLTLLGISIGLQLVRKRVELDPLALEFAIAGMVVTLLFAGQLFGDRVDRGEALLLIALAWAAAFVGLEWRRLPDLGVVVGTSALAFAAVGTADLLSDAALTIAWAAQALVFAALARRLGDARLQASAIVYAGLAAVHALATDGQAARLFDETADQLAALLPLAVAAAALTAVGLLVPRRYVPRTESGLLAVVADLRGELARHRRGLRETFVFAGVALGTLSLSFALVSISFEWGHIAASALAAVVGAVVLGVAGRLRSNRLAAAAYAWLGVVLVVVLSFDMPEFYDDTTALSPGGWSAIATAAALLGGAYAHRWQAPATTARDVLLGVVAGIAAFVAALGVALVTESATAAGLGLLAASAVYTVLAAGVFRRTGFRGVSTTLWSLGLVLLVGAELLLVTDSVWRTVTVATTAFTVGAVARPLGESRLWLAGGSLALLTSAIVVIGQVQPWLDESELPRRLALASAACALAAIGVAWLRFGEPRWRDLVTVGWADGIVMLLATERVMIGDWRGTAFAVALTGGAIALFGPPLREYRLWLAGAAVVGVTTVATIALVTPPSHFFAASGSPADGIWVLVGCILALGAVAVAAPTAPVEDISFMDASTPRWGAAITVVAGGLGLYAVSLLILEIAVRVSTASIQTDFERGHTAVSALWAVVGLTLLVIGLLRGSAPIRYGGLALFGLSLAKIFFYDLSELSSVARAFSFILVGGLLLAGGFFIQRLSDRIGPRHP
jgi:uncharacterized membrane protein